MLLIVFNHSTALWRQGGWFNQMPAAPSVFADLLGTWISSFHVYSFVVVSGYIYAYLRHEKNRYGQFVPFVCNKAKRLLVPYAAVAVCWVIPWQIVYFHPTPKDLLVKYLLGSSPSQLWFLLMLFWVFLASWVALDRFYSRPVAGLTVSLTILGCGMIADHFLPNYFQVFTACEYVLYFYIGMQLRRCWLEKCERIPWWGYVAADLMLFGVCRFIGSRQGAFWKLTAIPAKTLLHMIGTLMVVTVVSGIGNAVRVDGNAVYEFLKTHNFVIYLFHQQVIYCVITLLNGKATNWVIMLCSFTAAVAVSSFIGVVLSKFRFARFLVGMKP